MKIVLDVDGVLYKFSHAAQYMLAKRKGLKDREDLFWDDSTWDCKRPKEDWDWILGPEQANYVYRHGHLWSGAVEFVYALRELGDISLVTKRPPYATKVTLDWIRYTFDHEPFPFAEVRVLGPDEKKSQIPADVYIDDSLDNITELWENTESELIVVNRNWNQLGHEEIRQRISRAYSLEEVLEICQSLSLRKQEDLFMETEEKITDTLRMTSQESAESGEPFWASNRFQQSS
jgi:uncharacterized HAD superfamily protein